MSTTVLRRSSSTRGDTPEEIREAIRRVVAAAPPLSQWQVDELRAILSFSTPSTFRKGVRS